VSDSNTGIRLLALVLGFWLIMRTINRDATGKTLLNHLGIGTVGASALTQSLAQPSAVVNPQGQTNPFPGAVGSRLDQGFDLTAKQLLAPFAGTVVASNPTDPGWAGGGYLAIRSATNPQQVIYMAEGLAPVVQVGQTVQAGEVVAQPAINPYNGISGNIESGWANPGNPNQPDAQVAQNKPSIAESFYNWLRGLGGPAATSTANAGYP
jgi:biotin carboxyl carrier protein